MAGRWIVLLLVTTACILVAVATLVLATRLVMQELVDAR